MANYNFQLNFKNMFPAALWEHPRQEIVYRELKRYGLKEFYDRVGRLAGGLKKIGVKPGDTVAVLDWDTNRYMEAYFAVPMMGAVLHTVNIRYPPDLIFYTMQHAGDKYVILGDEFLPPIEKAASMFDFVKGWVVGSDAAEPPKTSLHPSHAFDELVASSEPLDFPDVNENTRATIFYTSGTTGMPKGVTFTQRQLVLHSISVAMVGSKAPFHLNEEDVYMSLVPMFHVHSWCMPYFVVLTGNKYVLPGRFDIKRILDLVKNEHVTYSFMVPPILYMLLTHPEIESYGKYLNGWKISVGGSALPKGLAQLAAKYGINAIGGYGLSETAPVLTTGVFTQDVKNLQEAEKLDYRISTGVPIPLVNLRIVNSEGKEVMWDNKSIGEITVRGPSLTEVYYKDDVKTEELWKGDWLHTGDLAVVDPLGYIHIVDREKDAVKSGGEFIPSLLLENIISQVPEVGEVAVIGKPDPKWGERPIAVVTAKTKIDKKKIMDFLNDNVSVGRIQKWWIPDDVLFVESMPKTSTNKIDKKELRKLV